MSASRIDLDGQVAVITGGAGELGKAIAGRLLRSGARVSLWDYDRHLLEKVTSDLDSNAVAGVVVDVTDAGEIQAAVDTTLSDLGRLDILINNAGVLGPVTELWHCEHITIELIKQILNNKYCHIK